MCMIMIINSYILAINKKAAYPKGDIPRKNSHKSYFLQKEELLFYIKNFVFVINIL